MIPGSGRSDGEGIGYPLRYSWASLVAQLVKNPPVCGRPGFDPWVGKICWRRERLPTPVFWPGEFHGLYSPWGHKELDTTERFSLSLSSLLIPVFPHLAIPPKNVACPLILESVSITESKAFSWQSSPDLSATPK